MAWFATERQYSLAWPTFQGRMKAGQYRNIYMQIHVERILPRPAIQRVMTAELQIRPLPPLAVSLVEANFDEGLCIHSLPSN